MYKNNSSSFFLIDVWLEYLKGGKEESPLQIYLEPPCGPSLDISFILLLGAHRSFDASQAPMG